MDAGIPTTSFLDFSTYFSVLIERWTSKHCNYYILEYKFAHANWLPVTCKQMKVIMKSM